MADGVRVLYVDDEQDLLDIGKVFLERSGNFHVGTFSSAQEALDSPSIQSWDVIISDYQMPGMNGIEFLKTVRERFGDLPFILFTGRGREEVVIEAINNGVDFYLQKGGDPRAQFAELAHKVRHSLRRRQAEYSLHDSERRLSDIIDFLPDATFAIDRAGTVIAWNRAIEEMIGIPARDMLGKEDYEYSLPFYGSRRPILMDLLDEPAETTSQFYSNFSRAGTTLTGETTFSDRNGNRVSALTKACPIHNQNGDIVGAIESIRDITDRKRAEETITRSKEYLDQIFSSVQAGIVVIDALTHEIVDINPAGAAMIGLPKDRIVNTICHKHICPAERGQCPITDLHNTVDNSERVLLTGTGEKLSIIKNVIWTTLNGRECLLETFIRNTSRRQAEDSLQKSESITIDTKPAMVTVPAEYTQLKQIEEQLIQKNEELNTAYQDLTATEEELRQSFEELSKNQEVLRISEEKYRTLVDLSLDGIVITDFSGNLLFANPAAGRIIEAADFQAMIGTRNVMEFVAPESRADVLLDISQVARGIDTYVVHDKLITEKKREVWVECIGKKVSFGDIPAMLVSMRDITESKQAETILRESENKFATIFKNNPVSLTLVSIIEGIFVDINDAFLRSTGYSRDEIIGKTAEELGLFVDRSEYEYFVSTLREQRTVSGMELKCRGKSGEIGICQFSSSIILMNGRPFILSTVDDVTERKTTERAVQALVRSMVDTTGLDALQKIAENISSWLGAECVMIGEIQPDGETVKVVSMLLDGEDVDGFSYSLKGTPCENVVEKGFCLYPDDAIRLFPESRDLVDLQIRGYLGTPLRNFRGEVSGVLCALSRSPLTPSPTIQEIMDIIAVKAAAEIERVRMDRLLRESEHLLNEAMDLTHLVHWEYDTGTGQFIFNDRFYTMYATSAEREGGYRISPADYIREFVHPEDHEAVAAIFFNFLPSDTRDLPDTEVKRQIEHRIVRRDGEVRHIMVRTGYMKDTGTEKTRFYGANQDITGRKRAEEALQQANRKLNMLSGITRHDIRNQLLKLDGFVELLQCEAPDPSLENYFTHITAASNQVANLIQFTSEYEKIGVHAPTWQDIRVLADQAGRDAGPGPVTLINDLPADSAVYADPMIVRIFFNLVDNALRHGGTITTIRFSVEERDGDQVIVCEDDGDGVAPDEKEKIFALGYGKNTGFGLAISREILDITGLTINEAGEAGTGARFEITVPAGQYRSTSS